jgi:integrase
MGARKHPNGKWYDQFQYNKKRISSLLCEWTADRHEPRNKKEADEASENFRAAVRNRTAFLPRNVGRDMSIAQFVEYYKENYWNQEQRTSTGDLAVMNVIKTYFDQKPLSAFEDPTTFIQFRNWLQSTPITVNKRFKDGSSWRFEQTPTKKLRSKATIRYYRVRLRHMVSFAKAFNLIEKDPFIDDKVLHFMGKTVKAKGRRRGVNETEIAALYAACGQLPLVGDLMKERLDVALALGMRRGEMLHIQLEDVDYDNWTLNVPGHKMLDGKTLTRNTKNGEDRIIPIPTRLQDLFKRKRRTFGLNKKAFLLGIDGERITNFTGAWKRLKKHAKLDDATLTRRNQMVLHWHDLRGEAGTQMRRRGYDRELIARILGNTPDVFGDNYEGQLLDLMRKAVEQ